MHTRRIALLLLCCSGAVAAADNLRDAPTDDVRYKQIKRLIERNTHLSGHLVFAVDARTIKEARKHVAEPDIPVLAKMLSDKDYGVASAAASLLALQGKKALPVLEEIARSRNYPAASHASDALRLLKDCDDEKLKDVMNADVCPIDSPGGRPRG